MAESVQSEHSGNPAAAAGVDRLQRRSGGFAMVALDQRESLRDMLSRPGHRADDHQLRDFKSAAISALSPHASAILLDRHFALDEAGAPVAMPAAGCAIILAADDFVQTAGQPVRSSGLDPAISRELIAASGADALKLLVIWRASDHPAQRRQTVEDFLALCAEADLPGIVEGVVRPSGATWSSEAERDRAIVAAAVEFGRQQPGLYKAEVPAHGHGDLRQIENVCADISEALDCPWVVLSTGVPPEAFPRAVAAACKGGASGFLAGRAIWAEAAASPDPAQSLAEAAVARLQALLDAVPGEHTD